MGKISKIMATAVLLAPTVISCSNLVQAESAITDVVQEQGQFVFSISTSIESYNGVILGNHTVNSADNEGATIVIGDIIANNGFTYGGAGSGASNIIGTPSIPENVPALVLGGNVIENTPSEIIIERNGYASCKNTEDLFPNRNIFHLKHGAHRKKTKQKLKYFFNMIVSQSEQIATDIEGLVSDTQANSYGTAEAASNNLSKSPTNDRVLVVNDNSDTFNIRDLYLKSDVLNAYDKIIFKSSASTVNIGAGAILLDNTVVDTGAPYGSPHNLLMQKIAKKVNWFFPNATQINTRAYGILGDVYAPSATFTANGGSLNGRLITYNLEQSGGFELHNFNTPPKDIPQEPTPSEPIDETSSSEPTTETSSSEPTTETSSSEPTTDTSSSEPTESTEQSKSSTSSTVTSSKPVESSVSTNSNSSSTQPSSKPTESTEQSKSSTSSAASSSKPVESSVSTSSNSSSTQSSSKPIEGTEESKSSTSSTVTSSKPVESSVSTSSNSSFTQSSSKPVESSKEESKSSNSSTVPSSKPVESSVTTSSNSSSTQSSSKPTESTEQSKSSTSSAASSSKPVESSVSTSSNSSSTQPSSEPTESTEESKSSTSSTVPSSKPVESSVTISSNSS
ncbi:hypothetical protein BG262_09050, partial [Floricoccus penangensis]